MMFSNKESQNIIETFSNLYVPVDCSEQDDVGFEFSLLKSIKSILRGWNSLTVSLKTCLSVV